MPGPDGPFTPMTAYYCYHDHERRLTFRWDGESDYVEMIRGDLFTSDIDKIPLQGAIYNADEASGWPARVPLVCQSHIRMEEEAQRLDGRDQGRQGTTDQDPEEEPEEAPGDLPEGSGGLPGADDQGARSSS